MTATTTSPPDTGSVPIIDVTRRLQRPEPAGRRRAPGEASETTTSVRVPQHRASDR